MSIMCLFVVSKTLKLDLVRCKPKTNNCMQPMPSFARALLFVFSNIHCLYLLYITIQILSDPLSYLQQ